MMDLSEITQKSQYFVPIDSASLLLYNSVKKSSCVRQAKFYDESAEDIEFKIIAKTLVNDIKNKTSKDKYTILFYGKHELAEKFAADINKKSTSKKETIILDESPRTSQTKWDLRKRSAHQIPSSQPVCGSASKRSKTNQELDATITFLNHKQDSGLKNIQKDLSELISHTRKEFAELKADLDELKKEMKAIASQTKLRRQYISGAINPVSQLCIEQMEEHRNKPGWYTKIKSFDWATVGLDEDQATNMQYVLTEENNPSILVGSVAYTLFGDKLITHLLGRNGSRDRKAKKNDRSEVLSSEEESKLRQVLGLFGSTFTNDTVWKKIVIYYVNQKGRDLKRKNERSDETQDITTHPEYNLSDNEKANQSDFHDSDENTQSPKYYHDDTQ